MELYKEIIAQYLSEMDIQRVFPNLKLNAKEIVEMRCYRALQMIKETLEDDSMEDRECFMRIEKIICALEEIGSSGGSRHDFG